MTTNMMKRSVGAVVAGLLMGGSAWAGYKATNTVGNTPSSREAWGSMAAARNSANDVEYIGCEVKTTIGGGPVVTCLARNAAGTTVQCTSNNSWMVQAANAISPEAMLRFHWNLSNECDIIEVENYSYHPPKQL